jgi:hypothetical protein
MQFAKFGHAGFVLQSTPHCAGIADHGPSTVLYIQYTASGFRPCIFLKVPLWIQNNL